MTRVEPAVYDRGLFVLNASARLASAAIIRQSLPHYVEEAIIVKRLIIGILVPAAPFTACVASGLRDVPDVETHLIMSQAARQTLALETDYSLRDVQALADVVHDARDIAASISSGSFKTAGMVILPCSMKTLSGIVHSYTDGLLTRAADVVLKERRPLVLCVRETPFHLGHLRLLVQAAEMGAVIMPPVPAFYHRPQTLDDVINQTVNRVIDQFDITLPEDLLPAGRAFRRTKVVREMNFCASAVQFCRPDQILNI
jgi:4-hydroxy-3-polyprenylbenzoate decarboxylase